MLSRLMLLKQSLGGCMKVPKQLQDPDFRFFLIGNNSKLPIEKSWNKLNCYPFFHEKLIAHKGNYGIVCGRGSLIVIDFDCREFYNTVAHKLPPTFTVLSASKQLPCSKYLFLNLPWANFQA